MQAYASLTNALPINLLITYVDNVKQMETISTNYKLLMHHKFVSWNVDFIMNLLTHNVSWNIAQIIIQMENVSHVLPDMSFSNQQATAS